MILLINLIIQKLKQTKTFLGQPMCDTFDALIDKAFEAAKNGDYEPANDLLKNHMNWLIIMRVVDKATLVKMLTPLDKKNINLFIGGRHEIENDICTSIDAEVRATGNSLVYAFGESKIAAFDTCNVMLYDKSFGHLRDCRGTAFNSSTLNLKGYGYAEYFDESVGSVSGYSMVILNENCNVASTPSVHRVKREKKK